MIVEYCDLSPDVVRQRPVNHRQPETDRRLAIHQWLTLHGVYCWRQPNDAPYSEKLGRRIKARTRDRVIGLADLGGILPDGTTLQIEIKSRHGRPTPEQTQHLERIRKSQGVAFVARSVDDVIAGLAAAGWVVVGKTLQKERGSKERGSKARGDQARDGRNP